MNPLRQNELLTFVDYVARHEHAKRIRQLLGHASVLMQYGRGAVKPRVERTDVLMLHATSFVGSGKKALSAMISDRFGLAVNQHFIGSRTDAVINGTFVRPDYRVHPMLALKAGIARYIVERYRPKVIVVSTEDTLVPFLRHEAARIGAKLVNIAHSVVFPSPQFAMCDYDYYFVYGRKSLEALEANPARYGATSVVLSGSLELGRHRLLPQAPNAPMQLTYFSSWVPKRHRKQYHDQFDEVVRFARARPEWKLVVRLHPLENGAYWRDKVSTFANIRLAGPDEPIVESVRGSCLTLCPAHSTTALDSACLNRLPIILDFIGNDEGYFDAYPGLMRRKGETLGGAVDRNLANLPDQITQMQKLVTDNLQPQGECQTLMSELIAELCRGHDLANACFIAQPAEPAWRREAKSAVGRVK